MTEPRSLLFVPGARSERFEKALAAGADLVCIDLEDAVPPDDKSRARGLTLDYLAKAPAHVGLRVNSLATAQGVADVNALMTSGARPAFVMLPKVEHEEIIRLYGGWLSDSTHIIPIIETATGLERAREILSAPRVRCAVFGGVDYAADAGCDLSYEGLLAPRSRLLNAAAVAGVTLLDVPYTDVRDLKGLADEIRRTRVLGMRARAAVHPYQVSVIHQALAPTAAEVEDARRVVEAFDVMEGRPALLDGKMIELPVIKAARRILAAQRDGEPDPTESV